MKNDPQLHHVCKKIVPSSSKEVIEIFSMLGCKVTYELSTESWFMLGQEGVPFDVQLIESPVTPLNDQFKVNSHVAFISENPKIVIDKIESWATENNILFKRGGWSERELWFDFPELFVDFVIEVMHVSILED